MLAVVSNCATAEWVEVDATVGRDVNGALYADPTTIVRSGDMVQMSILTDLKIAKKSSKGDIKSIKKQDEFDCNKKQWQTLSYSMYAANMGKGGVIYSSVKPQSLNPVGEDGSTSGMLWGIACGRQ